MIIVDSALEERAKAGDPIRVGLVGAGFMGRVIALQIVRSVPGMELVGISNRHIDSARRAYEEAGATEIRAVRAPDELDECVSAGSYGVTEDPAVLCGSESIDAIIEVTGSVGFGASVTLDAIRYGKHVILMNAELDGTLGPILKTYADRAGVIFSNTDGDQPGVIMNLYRFVCGLGVRPVLCGNTKGLQDPYRNPTTQEAFAKKWGQKPHMVTSFADGTKVSFEQAIVANATGMGVLQRGMLGPTVPAGTPIEEAADWYPVDELLEGRGVVDYVVGASPNPGIFVLGTTDHPIHKHYLNLYKLGEGPLYCFYTPYHLCHLELPNTVARAVLFHDAAIAPKGGPCVDVVTTAKVDLEPGQVLDGFGGYLTYGQCESSAITAREGLLPMGLAGDCRVTRTLPKDAVLTYDDVDLPPGRLSDRLRQEQSDAFGSGDTS